MHHLRDYQQDVVERVVASFASGKRSVCMVLPTGAGKTPTCVELCRRHIARRGDKASILWLAPLKELVKQARRAFPSDMVVETVDADRELQETLFPRVIISTVHTLVSSGYRPPASVLVVDEAQFFLGTPAWGTLVLDYIKAGTRIILMSATPTRVDGTALGTLADDLVVGPSVRDLIAWRGPNGERALTPCRVIGPNKGTDWLAEDPVAAYQTYTPGTKAAVFCQDTEHARSLAQRFNEAGIPAASADSKDREGMYAHQANKVRVLCNVFLMSVGYDDPSIETAILARGCSNVSTFLQICGRPLRPFPGKEIATIIDLKGVVHQYGFGLPDEPREYSLHGRAIKLRSSKKKQEPLKVCDKCKAMFRPGESACMCAPEIKPAGPSEIEVRRKTLQEIRATEPDVIKRSYFERYRNVAAKRKMKPMAAAFMYKQRYGHMPPMEWLR